MWNNSRLEIKRLFLVAASFENTLHRVQNSAGVGNVQEMRRSAPEIHRSKQRRLDETPGYSFKELGRFDYRAADAIAEGSQGFIITCQFRRYLGAVTTSPMYLIHDISMQKFHNPASMVAG